MNTDVVVVGAGVIGASIALELARSGRRVLVLDKAGGVGLGSTGASSAIIRFNFSTHAGVAASWEAQFCWRAWRDHLGCDVGDRVRFERSGLALLDVDAAPRGAYLPLFDAVGVPYEEWDADTLAARIPGLDAGRHWPPRRLDDERFWAEPTGTLGAVFTPDAGYISDPQLAAQNLAVAAERHGAEFRFRRTVAAVESAGDRVRAVILDDGTRVDCAIVVNAAGPWSGRVNELAGVGSDFTIKVRPLRQEVGHLTAPPGYNRDGAAGIAVADLDLGVYIRGEVGGGVLVGGTEPECDPLQWLDDPDAANPNPTPDVFEAQVTRAARRLTGLAVPNRPRGIVGVYDAADDWTPIYDRTALDGFYVAMGTSGNQFKNAPLVGQLMATLIDRVESGADHDADPVRFVGRHTGETIDLGAFSRRRPVNTASSGTVMG
ncbi:NAD(P)/FAD-dependent oxidoreductase [Embleya scabrispora]|uniref:NAD(P)/FAD-dependent oxidoreductase n=1 Tax=Embleya scabrispora TaxID=159449 RepID=UPI00036B3E2D|nr:FAD-dependent oxidoreductase [Embleya scabrispora]MYS81140.1 FAD-dependent oxidoreductase [Streptomyces sp. SID5474]